MANASLWAINATPGVIAQELVHLVTQDGPSEKELVLLREAMETKLNNQHKMEQDQLNVISDKCSLMENVLQWATNVTPGATPLPNAHPVTLDGPSETEHVSLKEAMEKNPQMAMEIQLSVISDKCSLMANVLQWVTNVTPGVTPLLNAHLVTLDGLSETEHASLKAEMVESNPLENATLEKFSLTETVLLWVTNVTPGVTPLPNAHHVTQDGLLETEHVSLKVEMEENNQLVNVDSDKFLLMETASMSVINATHGVTPLLNALLVTLDGLLETEHVSLKVEMEESNQLENATSEKFSLTETASMSVTNATLGVTQLPSAHLVTLDGPLETELVLSKAEMVENNPLENATLDKFLLTETASMSVTNATLGVTQLPSAHLVTQDGPSETELALSKAEMEVKNPQMAMETPLTVISDKSSLMVNVLLWAINVTPGVTPLPNAHLVTLDGLSKTEHVSLKAEMEESNPLENATLEKFSLTEIVWLWVTNVTPGVTPLQSAHPVTQDGPSETELVSLKAEMVENNPLVNVDLDKFLLTETASMSVINVTPGVTQLPSAHLVTLDGPLETEHVLLKAEMAVKNPQMEMETMANATSDKS